jgi:hypothetical protein
MNHQGVLVLVNYEAMNKKTIVWPAFYDAMGYPYPDRRCEMGLIGEEINWCRLSPCQGGSGVCYPLHSVTLPTAVQSYIHYAAYIPWLLQLYVVNSRSFHAEHKDSDVDLLVISQDGCTRRVRLCLIMLAKTMDIYRSLWDTADKVCLSFCLDHKSMDLSGMSLGQIDYYLIYRVAHATCIYTVPTMSPDAIRHANPKLMTYLPLFLLSVIPTQKESHWPLLLRSISHVIYILWAPIMMYRAKRTPIRHQWCICQPSVIKWYQDKRAIYNRLIRQKLVW